MTPRSASSTATPVIPMHRDEEPMTPVTHAEIFVTPTKDENFFIAEQQRAFLRAVARIRKQRPVNVGLRGPTGTGKSSLAEWFAATVGGNFFEQDMSTIREAKDLLGFKDIVTDEHGNQRIVWRKSGFVKAVTTPFTTILLDEASRIHPSVANNLMPLLDHRRRTYVDDLGEVIEVAEGVTFFLAANLGLEYSGTWKWDAALENRLEFQLEVGYLDQEREAEVLVRKTGVDAKIAKRLAEVASIIRAKVGSEEDPIAHAVSTRQLLKIAELVVEGISPFDAFEFTVIPTYSSDGGTSSDRGQVLAILQGKLGR